MSRDRAGGVVVTAWGPPERCEFLTALMPGLGPLMPPPPPGAPPPHPGALSEPGALAAVLKGAGLSVVEEGEVACPFIFPSAEASWRGNASAGVNQAAIAHSGEAAVRAVYAHADRAHTRPDGSCPVRQCFPLGYGRTAIVASLFREDATWILWTGQGWSGRTATEEGHAAVHKTVFRNSVQRERLEELTFVGPDAAVGRFYSTLTGGESSPDRIA